MEKEKLGVKDLKAREIAEIWGENENAKAFDERSIRSYIINLLSMDDDLKEEYFKDDNAYVVKKEVQHLFFCLLDSDFFSGKHKNSIKYRRKLNQDLLKSIDKWLDKEDKEKVKKSIVYIYEKSGYDTMVAEYFNSWWSLNEILFSSDIYIRYKLVGVVLNQVQKLCHITGNYKEKLEMNKLTLKEKSLLLLESDYDRKNNLADVLISMMVMKLKEKDVKKAEEEDAEEGDELLSSFLFPYIRTDETKYEEGFDFQKIVERYQDIRKQIENIFDEDNDTEMAIKDICISVLDTFCFSPDIVQKNFAESYYKEKEKIERTYLDFFINYQEVWDGMKHVRSKDYKRYMKFKDDERFKELLLKLEGERK